MNENVRFIGENPSPRRRYGRLAVVVCLYVVLYLPFHAKPVHIDDANFLMLAEGAARDPWRPHDILINWSGTTEPAFEILANPPGIAWYLMPVRRAPDWWLHLWMQPWFVLGAWGCWRLGRDYVDGDGYWPALFLLTTPVVVIAAHALTPDLPLFACMVAGIAGFHAHPSCRPWFALLAGCSALFRYSGGTAIPLLILLGWRRGGWRGALTGALSAVPIGLLVLHDLHAYGRVHLWTMIGSQNDPEHKTAFDAVHNWIAGLAMLGAAGILPILVWRRESLAGAFAGGLIGLQAAWFSGLNASQTGGTIMATAAGGAALSLALTAATRELFLSTWALGGSAFFLTVRFAATRYWAAFIPAVGLLALRNARDSHGWTMLGVACNVALALGIAIDDQNQARAYQSAALRVADYGPGTFSGHWGWQHYLERAGWVPLERGETPGRMHVIATHADVQLPDPDVCLTLVERFSLPDRWPGPRTYSWLNRAFYHAGGRGLYLPWTISAEPYDVVSVYERCPDEARDRTSHTDLLP